MKKIRNGIDSLDLTLNSKRNNKDTRAMYKAVAMIRKRLMRFEDKDPRERDGERVRCKNTFYYIHEVFDDKSSSFLECTRQDENLAIISHQESTYGES